MGGRVESVSRGEKGRVDVDLGPAVGELLLGDEVEDDLVALVVAKARDEAVELGPEGQGPRRRAEDHLEEGQPLLAGRAALVRRAHVLEGLGDVEVLLEVDAGLGARGHEIGHEPREVGKVADVGPVFALLGEHGRRIIPRNGMGGGISISLQLSAIIRRPSK